MALFMSSLLGTYSEEYGPHGTMFQRDRETDSQMFHSSWLLGQRLYEFTKLVALKETSLEWFPMKGMC